MSETPHHKSILKATGIFGFAQVLQMGVQVITTKVVANILGPSGIGLVGMLQNVMQLILTAVGFDLLKVGTREIALNSSEPMKYQKITEQLLRIGILVGFLGAMVSIAFAQFWSQFFFDTKAYTPWFYYFSIYFFAWGLTQGRIALLQGLRKVRVYATFQVVQVVMLSVLSILLYYNFGLQSIWMVILAGALVPMILVWFFTREEKLYWSWNFLHLSQTYQNNRSIIHLGLLLSVNAIIGQLCFLGIRSFLQHQDNFALVGYYEVSQALLVKYMGMLFVAMSYDFYPKLTSYITEPKKANKLMEHQIEIAMYLLAPAIAVFYIIGEYLVPCLYSNDFLPALEILQFGWLVLLLKAFTFPVGFYALAKGDKKTFFWQELLGDLGNLIASIVGYTYFGLIGLGLGWVISYLLYGIIIYIILYKKYSFKLNYNVLVKYFMLIFAVLALGFLHYWNQSQWLKWILMFTIVTFSLRKLIVVWNR